jgi:hypothetical protein
MIQRLCTGGLLLLGLVGLAGPAAAQAPPPVRLLLSYRSEDTAPEKTPRPSVLRPNVLQEVYAYVKNDSAEVQKVTAQLVAGGAVVASTRAVTVDGGDLKDLAAEGGWTPKPDPEKAPVLRELRGRVAFRLVDGAGKPLGKDLPVQIDRPANYVRATLTFYPGREGKNRLVAEVEPTDQFKGPRCRVELVLRPDRIPGLLPGQRKKGVYVGYLTRSTKKLFLVAEDLQFVAGKPLNGLVFLNVDGYERAFTFRTTFARSGLRTTADRIQDASLGITAPEFARPSAKFPVTVEVDDLTKLELRDRVRILLELGTPVPKEAKGADKEAESYSELAEFRGERDQHLFFAVGLRGGLLFRPEVKDWHAAVDLSGVFGPVQLRARMLDDKGDPIAVLDKERGVPNVRAVVRTVILDATPPEDVRFVAVAQKAVRGSALIVYATGTDPESGIAEVAFFRGRPLAGGKVPETVMIPGELVAPKRRIWGARIAVAKDERGPVVVSVRFTNRVGLSTMATRSFEVTDPPKARERPPDKGSIAGTIVEGDRPQVGLPVRLYNSMGKQIDTTKTTAGGAYIFRGLDPGTYRVVAIKTASRTRGERTVEIKAKERKTGVDIKLYRRGKGL